MTHYPALTLTFQLSLTLDFAYNMWALPVENMTFLYK